MKLSQFQSHLRKEKVNLVFLAHPDMNIAYFAQMEPSHAFMTITPKGASLYLSKLDLLPKVKGITLKNLDKNWKKNIANTKVKRVGINKSSLTVSTFEKAKKLFPKAKFVDVGNALSNLRKEKTSAELSRMKKACDITAAAFNAILKELKKRRLKTEQDVAFFLEKYIKDRGCSLAFPTIAAMGKNAAIPHHVTSNERLRKGFLLMDFGARYKNYCADMTRVVYLGKPTAKEMQFYELLKESQQAAIDAVREGISFKDLTDVSRKVLGKYEKYFVHGLGHGIGIEVHEDPVFSAKGTKVEKNVPFTIEPGLYFPGKFGLRIEDTVVWDGKKLLVFTKQAPKELLVLR